MLLDQAHRVARLKVVGEDEHADLGMLADLVGGDEPFVGLRGRHFDVDDRDVRVVTSTLRCSSSAVPTFPTTSNRVSGSRRSSPSLSSTSSSAITTRTQSPRGLSA